MSVPSYSATITTSAVKDGKLAATFGLIEPVVVKSGKNEITHKDVTLNADEIGSILERSTTLHNQDRERLERAKNAMHAQLTT